MEYQQVLERIISDLPKIIETNNFSNVPGVYIGKTSNITERSIDHEQNDKLFYLTALVTGNSNEISKLENDLIENLNLPLV